MTKRKTNIEIALSDVKKGQKLVRDAVARLESYLSSRDKKIDILGEALESEKESYENKFQKIFGESIDNYLVGYGFERHVVWWMNTYHPQYELKIWQSDKMANPYEDGDIIYPSWNQYPDLVYVNERDKKVLALECKYRFYGKLDINQERYNKYKEFEKVVRDLKNYTVDIYVMVGNYGLSSDKPENMYCFPIDYFKNTTEVDLKDVPQFKVMERAGGIVNISNNCPF